MATWYSQGSGLWSTLANWNDAADGSGSAPGSIAAFDDSPVVIQAGHVVEFDVEDAVACDGSVSGWTTGIAGITITGAAAGNTPGELTLTDTVNNADRVYGLRLKANTAIVGTNVAVLGKVTGGTESVPLPTGAVHIIQFLDPPTTGGFNLTYLSLALYCAAPVETVYVTTAAAGVGDSVLSVEGRLTGCNPNTDTAEWQVGRAVRVIRTTSAGVNTQATTIAGVGDGTITLGDNLTVAKPAGSLVVLEQRNIEIRDSAATSTNRNLIANGTGAVLDCAIRSLRSAESGTRAIFSGTSHTVQGSATISGCSSGIYVGTSHVVQGSATISGCSSGIYVGTSHVVQGSAVISGCIYAIMYGTSHVVQESAVISGCTRAIYQSANALVAHTASITGCTTNYQVDTADDSVFSYTTPSDGTDVFADYKLNVAPAVATPRVEIWPVGYTAAGTAEVTRRYPSTYIYGSYPRTWCNGGKTQSQTSVLPTGHTVGGQMIFEQHADIVTAGNKALYCWNWVAVPVTVGANQRARITVNVRKDTSFAGYTETPMVQVVDALYDGTDIDVTYEQTSSMTDNQDTWQTYSFTVNDPGLHFVRIIGRHDTGNLYYTVTVGYEYTGVGGAQVKPARGWRITDDRWDDIYRGIEGLWLFNDGSGTIVADSSGHGRHGTAIGGPVWQAGATGWQLSFDGVNDYVSAPMPVAVWAGDYTVALRVAQQPDTNYEGIFGVTNAAGDGVAIRSFIGLAVAGTSNRWAQYDATLAAIETKAIASDTGWHTVVGGVTGVKTYISRDASTPVLSGSSLLTRTAPATTCAIGASVSSTGSLLYAVCQIDYVAIWSRALSASEVRRLHEQPPWMVG